MAKKDDLSGLTAKMYAEIKGNIQSIAIHPPHTAEWRTVAERVVRIASIVESERQIAEANAKAGKVVDTLWDPKGDEWALRYLLAEGKLNLLLRLVDAAVEQEQRAAVCAWASAEGDLAASLAALTVQPGGGGEAGGGGGAAAFGGGGDASLAPKLQSAVCAVVCAAWRHREGLQTTDLPTVAALLQRCLGLCLSPSHAASRRDTGLLAARLLSALGAALTSVGEEKVIPELGRAGVFALLPTFATAMVGAGVGVGEAGGGNAGGGADEDPPLLACLVGASRLMAGEEFAVIRTTAVKGASLLTGCPGPDAVLAAVLARHDVGMTASSVASSACVTPPTSPVPLPTGVESHVSACASLSKGAAAAALGLGDLGVKRRVRPLLDYADAVARAVKR